MPPGQGQFAAVSVTTQPTFAFGTPVSLTTSLGPVNRGAPDTRRRFDMMPDGSGFLEFSPSATHLTVAEESSVYLVINWTDELKRLVPTSR